MILVGTYDSLFTSFLHPHFIIEYSNKVIVLIVNKHARGENISVNLQVTKKISYNTMTYNVLSKLNNRP